MPRPAPEHQILVNQASFAPAYDSIYGPKNTRRLISDAIWIAIDFEMETFDVPGLDQQYSVALASGGALGNAWDIRG